MSDITENGRDAPLVWASTREQGLFYNARIELHPGEIDKLW